MSVTLPSDRLATGAEFLTALERGGYQPDDIHHVARAFQVAQTEIDKWAKNARKAPRTEVELNIQILACGAERAFLNRGKVLTPAILEADGEQLHEYIDFYEAELSDLWVRLSAREAKVPVPGNDHEWLLMWHRFERLAGFLWECNTKSGVYDVTHPRGVS